jgi:hypothetical protein
MTSSAPRSIVIALDGYDRHLRGGSVSLQRSEIDHPGAWSRCILRH